MSGAGEVPYHSMTQSQWSKPVWCGQQQRSRAAEHQLVWRHQYGTTLHERTHTQTHHTCARKFSLQHVKTHSPIFPTEPNLPKMCQVSMADRWHATKVCNGLCATQTAGRMLWGAGGVPLLRVRPDAPTLWGNRNTLTSSLLSNSLMAALAYKSNPSAQDSRP